MLCHCWSQVRYVFTCLRVERDHSAFADDSGMIRTCCSNRSRSGNAAYIESSRYHVYVPAKLPLQHSLRFNHLASEHIAVNTKTCVFCVLAKPSLRNTSDTDHIPRTGCDDDDRRYRFRGTWPPTVVASELISAIYSLFFNDWIKYFRPQLHYWHRHRYYN